ncbi:TPA: hypothetical protein DF272_06480 [Candidatus Falkowbacteria bacterium]|nr:hypothetical protein [Candidatus Falkowbacteria bacterium]
MANVVGILFFLVIIITPLVVFFRIVWWIGRITIGSKMFSHTGCLVGYHLVRPIGDDLEGDYFLRRTIYLYLQKGKDKQKVRLGTFFWDNVPSLELQKLLGENVQVHVPGVGAKIFSNQKPMISLASAV